MQPSAPSETCIAALVVFTCVAAVNARAPRILYARPVLGSCFHNVDDIRQRGQNISRAPALLWPVPFFSC